MSLSQISSAHADGLGRAERCEAVHECDADLNLCILPVEVSRHLRSWCAPPPGPRSKANADCRARRLRRQHGRMPRQNRSSPSMVPSPRHCSAVPGRRQGQTIAPKRQRHIPRRRCLTQMRQRGPGPEGRSLRRLGRRRDDPARQRGQHRQGFQRLGARFSHAGSLSCNGAFHQRNAPIAPQLCRLHNVQ